MGEVLAEVIYVLDAVYTVPKDLIIDKLITMLVCYEGIDAEKYLLDALLLFKRESLHIVDCMIIEKSKIMDMVPLSFDKKLLKLWHKNLGNL